MASRAFTAEVHDHLLQLPAIRLDAGDARPKAHHDLHIFADEALEHRPHAGDDRVEIEQRRLDDLLAAEGQQLAGELGGALAGFPNRRDVRPPGIVRVEILEQQLAIPQHHGEQVVEIVGDASGEPSDRFHLLGLLKLRLQRAALRDVQRNTDAADRLARGVENDAARATQPPDRAVTPERAVQHREVGAALRRVARHLQNRRAVGGVNQRHPRFEGAAERHRAAGRIALPGSSDHSSAPVA